MGPAGRHRGPLWPRVLKLVRLLLDVADLLQICFDQGVETVTA